MMQDLAICADQGLPKTASKKTTIGGTSGDLLPIRYSTIPVGPTIVTSPQTGYYGTNLVIG